MSNAERAARITVEDVDDYSDIELEVLGGDLNGEHLDEFWERLFEREQCADYDNDEHQEIRDMLQAVVEYKLAKRRMPDYVKILTDAGIDPKAL
jgi:hypothetical protein